MTMTTEQGILRASIAVTVLVAVFGIVFGVLSHSTSIAFDGVYALADASMSALALIVSNLIASYSGSTALARRLRERFTMGFWHLEPMVLGLNGVLLMGVSIYAFINAITSLIGGGRKLDFSYAIVYAAVTLIACAVMAVVEMRANRKLRSDFVALDAKAWLMSGGITAALLIAFALGYAVEETRWVWIAPYIDPAVLALICIVITPMPVGTVKQALSEVLLVTPDELKQQVAAAAEAAVKKYGFLSYRAYAAKVGRAKQIELYFIVPQGWPAKTLEEWDHIRDEIGDAIGGDGPDRWLTIAFTTDIEWAE